MGEKRLIVRPLLSNSNRNQASYRYEVTTPTPHLLLVHTRDRGLLLRAMGSLQSQAEKKGFSRHKAKVSMGVSKTAKGLNYGLPFLPSITLKRAHSFRKSSKLRP